MLPQHLGAALVPGEHAILARRQAADAEVAVLIREELIPDRRTFDSYGGAFERFPFR